MRNLVKWLYASSLAIMLFGISSFLVQSSGGAIIDCYVGSAEVKTQISIFEISEEERIASNSPGGGIIDKYS